jgi:hypothetical protein
VASRSSFMVPSFVKTKSDKKIIRAAVLKVNR